jgi:hypothetical protein
MSEESSFLPLSKDYDWLTDYAVNVRYDSEIQASDYNAQCAVDVAVKVRDFAPIAALRKEAAAAIQAEVIAQVETNK